MGGERDGYRIRTLVAAHHAALARLLPRVGRAAEAQRHAQLAGQFQSEAQQAEHRRKFLEFTGQGGRR
jgi:hypothetical protein